MISTVYQENSPELIYFMTLYNIFSEFLDDISEDVLPNEATGFKDSVSGISSTIFRRMLLLPLLVSWSSTTVVFLLIVSALVRLSQHWLLSNITREETRMFWFYARRNFQRIG
jgi:hypothetical protein